MATRINALGTASKRPTILDVAAACGVSPATVSNVLAEKRHIAESTRALVLEKVRELGYVASATARGLRMSRTWSIGVVVGDIANPFNPEVVRGIEETLWAKKNSLILCNTDSVSERKVAYLQNLIDKHVDGLILISQSLTQKEANALDMSRLPPLVTINRFSEVIEGDHVTVQNEGGVRELMQHLFDLGHQRIAFIKGMTSSTSAKQRYDAYRSSMKKMGFPVDRNFVIQGDYTMESGVEAANKLLELPVRPTAIVAANDAMAIGVLGVLRDRGVSVPNDISVAGFDDIFMARHPLIALTTVEQPKYETGATAARLLLERIEDGPETAVRRVTLDATLKIRGTTGHAKPD